MELLTQIGAAVAIIVSAVTAYLQWQRFETDKDSSLTDTSIKLVRAVRDEMEENKKAFDAELAEMKKKLDLVLLENAKLRAENAALLEKLEDAERVQEWAERLVHQVISLRAEPVKIKTGPLKVKTQ